MNPSPALRLTLLGPPQVVRPDGAVTLRSRKQLALLLYLAVEQRHSHTRNTLIALRQALGGARLVTLTGAAGCGKSRLALAVAEGLVPTYADGVWLEELEALRDPARVPQVVATALGLHGADGLAAEAPALGAPMIYG